MSWELLEEELFPTVTIRVELGLSVRSGEMKRIASVLPSGLGIPTSFGLPPVILARGIVISWRGELIVDVGVTEGAELSELERLVDMEELMESWGDSSKVGVVSGSDTSGEEVEVVNRKEDTAPVSDEDKEKGRASETEGLLDSEGAGEPLVEDALEKEAVDVSITERELSWLSEEEPLIELLCEELADERVSVGKALGLLLAETDLVAEREAVALAVGECESNPDNTDGESDNKLVCETDWERDELWVSKGSTEPKIGRTREFDAVLEIEELSGRDTEADTVAAEDTEGEDDDVWE